MVLKFKLIFLVLAVFIFTGCVAYRSQQAPGAKIIPDAGIYHRVEQGQTLWRISKIYNIDLEELVRINRIDNPREIKGGQLIFIPQGKKVVLAAGLSQGRKGEGEDFIWPVKGRVINIFGQRVNNIPNQGIDIQAPFGTEIVACRTGVVSFYHRQLKGLGKTVIIDHGDNFLTVYARNSDVFVKTGERVSRGAVIAKVGTAGRDKTAYLHFQIRKGHIPRDPFYYLP